MKVDVAGEGVGRNDAAVLVTRINHLSNTRKRVAGVLKDLL